MTDGECRGGGWVGGVCYCICLFVSVIWLYISVL